MVPAGVLSNNSQGAVERDKVFKSKEALDGWLWGLAERLATRLSTDEIKIGTEAAYAALRAELTVGDVMKLAA